MSDEEDYEYEYDDDAEDMEEEEENNQFEYTDEEEDQDDAAVALENSYYNAKGLRETDITAAAAAFEQVITQEHAELNKYGPWSYKAMKQLVKLHLRAGQSEEMMKHYRRLLECVSTGDVSPNAVEKGMNAMMERVASNYQGNTNKAAVAAAASHGNNNDASSDDATSLSGVALAVYDATLAVFHPITGACKNERLWFKTTLKYGQLLYERHETTKLQQVLRDLQAWHGTDKTTSSTASMEIYALQIQLYSRQKDHKKLRETFTAAMAVRGGIPHPRTAALIQELGGKMHMSAKEYEHAGKTFFSAFKSYDEAGDPSRLRCLKYLVLASMLHASTINPFDSQEARPYRDDPEIVAMTALVQAFHNHEIRNFEKILRQNNGRIMKDEFVREHLEDLLRTIRTQVLRNVLKPYKRITLKALAAELNDIAVADVESLLVGLILDGSLQGTMDQVTGVFYKQGDGDTSAVADTVVQQRIQALQGLLDTLEECAVQVTNARVKEIPTMRGMVH